jgi:hypothetical protein
LLVRLLLCVAEAVVNDYVVFIHASLHLLVATPCQKGKGRRGQERCSDAG